MPGLEHTLVAHLSETRYEDLPAEAVEAARRCVIDTLGVAVAGSSGENVDTLLAWLSGWGGQPEATVLVHGTRLPAVHAAWANGAMARAREFDDSHDPTGDHTSVPILAAAMATAELVGDVSGRDFLAAYVLAADLVARLRLAPMRKVGASAFAANSYAPFAAAAASARLLGLRGQQMYDALGWAYAQCAGAVQLQQGGGSTLHVQHGLAAGTGLQAALLARQGLPGTEEFLSGKFGLFNAYEGGNYDPAVVLDGLGQRYEITRVSVKLYPCGRVIHPPVEAALRLREAAGFDAHDIESVVVVYTRGGYTMTCEPEPQRRIPSSVQHAKFSLYYNVACALARGRVDLEDFTPAALADERVRQLIPRIHVEVDPSLTQVIPPGVVTVRLKDGREMHRRLEHVRGTPEDPLSFDDCVAKLRRCLAFAARPLDPDKVEAAIWRVRRLEAEGDVGELARLLVAVR